MDTVARLKSYLKKIEKEDKKGKKINAFLELNKNAIADARKVDKKISSGKTGRLAGKIIAVKACINVKGMKASCASKTLENYQAGYDATAVKKILEQDGIIIGITNMDEFACGSSGETSAFGATKNPAALDEIPGGSSSGSCAAVAEGFCDMALGTDTGGSIRNPASHCGVIGLKPSYGAVSRYGLIDLSMSLDQIGPIAKSVSEAKVLFDVIKGRDENDPTTYEIKDSKTKDKKFIIGIFDFDKLCSDKRISQLIKDRIDNICSQKNWQIKKIELPTVDLAIQTYYPLVYTEFFSGTRKFDGRRFGKKIEETCGPEALRRILGGMEISQAEYKGKYYRSALKAKEIIKQEFEKAFKQVDAIVLPCTPRLPHKIGSTISVEDMYAYDAFTIPANLAEICAICIPAGTLDNIPVGMQIFCGKLNEETLFKIAKGFEKD